MLEVNTISGIELTEAVIRHEADDVLLSLGWCFKHVLSITFTPESINHLNTFLAAVFIGCGGLVVKRQTDVVVLKHLVHYEQEVDDTWETKEGYGLIDNLTDFTRFYPYIECSIHMDTEFGDCTATQRGSKDTHDASFLNDRTVSNFECLVKSEIVEDGC